MYPLHALGSRGSPDRDPCVRELTQISLHAASQVTWSGCLLM